jgi:thiol-disulfide isomerase/thioredoxin
VVSLLRLGAVRQGDILKKLRTFLLLVVMALTGQQAWAGKAVNFVLTDTKGKVHRLSDYSGKWVLINFWAPWCPRCWMEFPLLNDLDTRKDFVVLGVAMDYGGNESSALSYANRYNLRYPQIMAGNRRDQNSPSHQIGPVDFYPTSYLYAPDSELVMFMGQYARENPTAFAASQVETSPEPAPIAPAAAAVTGAAAAASAAKPDAKKVTPAVKPAKYKKATSKSTKKKVRS